MNVIKIRRINTLKKYNATLKAFYCRERYNKSIKGKATRKKNYIKWFKSNKGKLYFKNYRKNNRKKILKNLHKFRKTTKGKIGMKYNKNKRRIQNLKRMGLTLVDYNNLKKNQNGYCAICKEKRKLNIDHNHKTGKVRALLCHRCNAGIGFLRESIFILKSSIKYLRRHNERN